MSPSAGRHGTADTIHLIDQHFDEAGADLGGLQTGGRLQQAGGPLAGRDLLVVE